MIRAAAITLESLISYEICVLDTERNVLLDLNSDYETVLAGYVANLKHDAEIDAAYAAAGRAMRAAPQTLSASASTPAGVQPARVDQTFTGNVEVTKPWWKLR